MQALVREKLRISGKCSWAMLADKGFFQVMTVKVHLPGANIGECPVTPETDMVFFSGVTSLVCFQIAFLLEGFVTKGTFEGHFPGVSSQVSFQVVEANFFLTILAQRELIFLFLRCVDGFRALLRVALLQVC